MNKGNMAKMAIWTGYMPANAKSYSDSDYMNELKEQKK
ncbi:hypothetical protein STAIW_v1c07230 [Spiroplasma taiwanense CT-1]|uniref:Uncharacterized protein n=1 Tax=Spiroplasma taiwanense CT-1 TaxID=1276220 RepID=S5MHK4_9MOLU|nr:hypothetical protein STAIW_v1c07230 [Spiroplasma taiwanense CT-1]